MNTVRVTSKLFIFFSLLILSFLFWNPLPVLAHRPHDVISQVELSPNYAQDQTVFIIVREQFLKSTDGGKSWERVVNGIDNEDYFSSLALSHQNNQILFLSSLGDGIYKTENGGNTWFKVNNGLTNLKIDVVEISLLSDEIVLASADNVLYQTSDGGKNWQPVIQAKDVITAIGFSPTQKNIFVVGDRQGHLYRTIDQGKSWQQMASIANRDPINAPNGNAITTIALLPDTTVIVGTGQQGIHQATIQGDSIQEMNQGMIDPKILNIVISPNYAKDSLIFASTWDEGVFISENNGKNWHKSSNGLTKDSQADVSQFNTPHFQDLRISSNFAQDQTVFLGGFNGLFQSTNGGKHWKELETLSTRVIVALNISPNHAQDSTVAIGTYEQEAYISHNQGKTWKSMLNGLSILKYEPKEKNSWSIETPRFYDLLFSPNYQFDKTLFASLLYKFAQTRDGGQSWNRTPLPVVATNRDILIVVSPNYAKDKTVYAASKYGGAIYQSKNGGKQFSAIGQVDDLITALVASPNFAVDQTMFASTFKGGIYKSMDQGRTWHNVIQTSGFSNFQWLNIAVSPNYQVDQRVLAATDQGVIQTLDAGVTWTPLKTTPYSKEAFIEAIAMSPDYKNDQTFIVEVRGHGLFKTTDGGQTFNQIGKDLIQKNYPFSHMVMSASIPIQFSPTYAQDRTLYGFGSTKAEIYRSTDSGETWEVLFIPRQFDLKAAFFDHLKLVKLVFRVYPWLKFVAGTIGALFTYFLLGALPLDKRLPFKRWQLKIGGSLLAFIALWILLSD